MAYKEKQLEDDTGGVAEMRKLILFNSSHMWDDVVEQLIKATGYDPVHCEQIAVIAHTKGKAVVKSGDLEELSEVNSVLKEINLITVIE